MPPQSRILLTGATGYLGSHLSTCLTEAGYLVYAVKRPQSSLRRLAGIESRMRFLASADVAAGSKRPLNEPLETIIHVATCYGRNGENEHDIRQANVAFPMDVLRFAKENGARRLINIDTSLPAEFNTYSRSKKQFRAEAAAYCRGNGIQFVNVVLEHFFGPGDDESKFTTFLIRSCMRNVPEIKLTAGDQLRDFIYIEDAIKALYSILAGTKNANEDFLEFAVGSGSAISVRKFSELAHEMTGSRTILRFGAVPYRDGEPMFLQADTAAIRQLGWQCQVSTKEGIRLTVEQEK